MFGKDKMNSQMLTDITRGIHHAVNTTGTMISQQYIMMLQQFFDTLEDGSIVAKMVKVQVDEQHDMMVPLVALVAPQGIALDKMRFELSVQITESELKRATHEVDGLNAERCAFKVNLSPKSSDSARRRSEIVDVEMQFTRSDAPEGMHRIIEQYANMIQPYKPRPEDEENTVPHPPNQPPEQSFASQPEASSSQQGDSKDEELSASLPKAKYKRRPNVVSMNTKSSSKLDE